MNPEEEQPSAEDLVKEHEKSVKARDNWVGELEDARKDEQESAAQKSEVAADSWRTPSDEINADAEVSGARARVADAEEHVERYQKRYDANIEQGQAHSADFVEEARAEMEAHDAQQDESSK